MILHRLRLTNFRGVGDREITFPDQGVVVVCGPNEVGKSSMLEALDLLLTYRDRSSHRDVKAVKPAHADVGAEVEAEMSTGPYRFVYRKRFHKKTQTELEMIEPARGNLSGDAAHERVEAMLGETLDTKLWEAQRVLQSSSTTAVNLSGSDALSRALDAAAGEADTAPTGDDSLLIDRVDAEYLKYFTATGRPTGVWKAVIERVNLAESEAARCQRAVEEVDERIARHESLTSTLQRFDAALTPALDRLTAARKSAATLAELREQLRQARLAAADAAVAGTNSALANGQRQQLVADGERRATTLSALHASLAEAQQQQAQAQASATAAAQAAAQSAAALQAAQQRLEAARAAAQACTARDEAERLTSRVAGIDGVEKELAEIAERLCGITLTADQLAEIERHGQEVARIEAQLHADAATVAFTPAVELQITVDGQPRTLPAGQSWVQPASAEVTVDVPGVLTVRVDPGASSVKLRADLTAAQQRLDRELASAGVPDLTAARALDTARRELTEKRGTLAAKLEGLCDGEDTAEVRVRLAELLAAVAGSEQVDSETALADLKAADAALRAARGDADTHQQAAEAATAVHTAKATEATVQHDRRQTAEAEFALVREQLATLRAVISDEAIAAQASADADAQRRADAAVSALAERYDAAEPAAVESELAAASDAVDTIAAKRDRTTLELHALGAELGVIGSEGRQGQLDEAQAELERARAEYARIHERAQSAQLLLTTMIRHRDNTRQRYVRPYRAELERLGREVFGPSFEVDVDTELTIQTRTLDGCTVPYDSLSGGAKEQLGILARLAGAALVAAEDTVPVIIDDALGFSDPDRLEKMSGVLNTVGDRGQVIVLTCTPGRYDGVADAEVIELSA